jgi:hypothetical protein
VVLSMTTVSMGMLERASASGPRSLRSPNPFVALISLALVLAGCSKSRPPADDDPPADTATAPDTVGIPECDAYLKKYESCLRRSKSRMAHADAAFKAQRDSFRIAAGTPEGKSTLPAQCKSLHEKLLENPVCKQ